MCVELQNVVERAVITARGGPIFFELPSSSDVTQASERHVDGERIQVRTHEELRDAECAVVDVMQAFRPVVRDGNQD